MPLLSRRFHSYHMGPTMPFSVCHETGMMLLWPLFKNFFKSPMLQLQLSKSEQHALSNTSLGISLLLCLTLWKIEKKFIKSNKLYQYYFIGNLSWFVFSACLIQMVWLSYPSHTKWNPYIKGCNKSSLLKESWILPHSKSLKQNINFSKGISFLKFIIFACWLVIIKKIKVCLFVLFLFHWDPDCIRRQSLFFFI